MVRRSIFARLFGKKETTKTETPRAGGRVVDRTGAGNGSRISGSSPKNGGNRTTPPVADKDEAPAAERAPEAKPVAVERVTPPASTQPTGVKPTKLGPQEELSLKVTEGLDKLSGLLGGIDDKLAAQTRQRQDLAAKLEALPTVLASMVETQKAQLEATQAVRTEIQRQGELTKGTADAIQKVPAIMDGLGSKLDQHARAGTAVKDSVDGVGKSVRSLADGTQRAQNTLLAEFRRAQDEQRRRLDDLVTRERKVFYGVAVIGLAVLAGLIFMIVSI